MDSTPCAGECSQASGQNQARHSKFPVQHECCLTIAIWLYNILVMSRLDAAFAALADPTRRAILARLASGELTVMELAKPFAISQPAVTKHLKVLEEAGLISRRVEGSKRPRQLARDGVDAIDQWLGVLRKALARNYDRLDSVLAEIEASSTGSRK